MKAPANDHYTPSPPQGQRFQRVSVAPCPRHVDISIAVPWEQAPIIQHLFGAVTGQLNEAIGVHEVEETDRQVTRDRIAQQANLRRRQFNRIGRLAARALRREPADGHDGRSLLNELADRHGTQVGQLEILIRLHQKHTKVRYDRLVERRFVRMVAAGATTREIAQALGWSPSKVDKRRATLRRQLREASNDR